MAMNMSKLEVTSVKLGFDFTINEPTRIVDFTLTLYPFQNEEATNADISLALDEYFKALPLKYPEEFKILNGDSE